MAIDYISSQYLFHHCLSRWKFGNENHFTHAFVLATPIAWKWVESWNLKVIFCPLGQQWDEQIKFEICYWSCAALTRKSCLAVRFDHFTSPCQAWRNLLASTSCRAWTPLIGFRDSRLALVVQEWIMLAAWGTSGLKDGVAVHLTAASESWNISAWVRPLIKFDSNRYYSILFDLSSLRPV